MDTYSILGIPRNSSKDEARAAYRRLAQKYHPDRADGNEEMFKRVKAAYEDIMAELDAPPAPLKNQTRSRTQWTAPEPVWPGYASFEPKKQKPPFNPYQGHRTFNASRNMYTESRVVQAYREPEQIRKNIGEYIARVSLAEAYNGFICEIQANGKKIHIPMPKGIPHGLQNTMRIPDSNEDVSIRTLFTQSMYSFVGVQSALKESVIVNSEPGIVYRTKDLRTVHEVHSRDLRFGSTIELLDFLGEKYSVRIPAGHDPRVPIKVQGRGYVDWYTSHSSAGTTRGDVYIDLAVTENLPITHIR